MQHPSISKPNANVTNRLPYLKIRQSNRLAEFQKVLVTLAIVLASYSSALSATFVVTKTADTSDAVCDADCSLREAIAAANLAPSNDQIQFDDAVFVASSSINLILGELTIANSGSLEILGTDSNLLTIRGVNSRVFGVSFGAAVLVSRLTISGGRASNNEGGGVRNSGVLTLEKVVVRGNFATFDGGGIYSTGTLTINNSEVSENGPTGISQLGGGGLVMTNSTVARNLRSGIAGGPMTINGSTIFENRGGGIGTVSSSIVLRNSTVTGNYGRTQGSGIETFNGPLSLINSTVAFNRATAANGAGIAIGSQTTATVRNSIVANNIGAGTPSDIAGVIVSQGYNLIGNTSFLTITGNTTGNKLNVDPLLQPLSSRGGITQVHALQEDSPAIDAGDLSNILETDQRGVTRPFDGDGDGTPRADIGAVESGILVSNTNDNGPGSLRNAITDANLSSANDEIRFSRNFLFPQTIILTGGELEISGGGKLFLNGPGSNLLTVSGNNQSRIFTCRPGSDASISGVQVSFGRTATNAVGGGIRNDEGSVLLLSGVKIMSNEAKDGGGIFNSGTLRIVSSMIDQNVADDGNGGGIAMFSGILEIEKSVLSDNVGTVGGAISGAGTLTINNSRIIENHARNNGGGIFVGGVSVIRRSVIHANTAMTNGGGIYSSASSLQVWNSTLSNNLANADGGGGMFVVSGATMLRNTTIAFNRAFYGGGIANGINGTVHASSNIIANNLTTSAGPDFQGVLNSEGYNLISINSGFEVVGQTIGNQLGVNPHLLPLELNGGETETFALAANSPAIDAGSPISNSAVDQRGFSRATDGNGDGFEFTDIGAYESGPLVVNVADNGPGSLRQAVLNARNGGGTGEVRFGDLFSVPQTIVLTSGELNLTDGSLHLNGLNNLTISGNNQSRVFNISISGSLYLVGVRIVNGRAFNGDGGGIINAGALRLTDSQLSNNTANGGGSEPKGGGAIYNNGGSLILTDSRIDNNSTTSGDGAGLLANLGTIRVVRSIIDNNISASNGGGLANIQGEVELVDSRVCGNRGSRSGGILNLGNLLINGTEVCANVANQLYGGIYNGANLIITKSSITQNRATNDGGGIFNLGKLSLKNSIISGNVAARGGGINNNGGVNNDRGVLIASNSTISQNTSSSGGAGIYTVAGRVELTNMTLAFNRSTSGPGGVQSAQTVFLAGNSIFANNVPGTNAPADFSGQLESTGYNLVQNTTGLTITGNQTGNLYGLDPLLDPILRLNNGLNKTHALRATSPVIDRGRATDPTTKSDQREFPRPYDFPTIPNAAGGNGSDIGAFERQPTDVVKSTPFDFDGDGKTDLSIFRPGTGEWWWNRSGDSVVQVTQFGAGTDVVSPGDFTGDGKMDIAFFRPSDGFWNVLRSEDFSYYAFPFGTAGDVPVTGDYDGDGKADVAVFRPSSSTWFIARSSDGGTTIAGFGIAGDVPVAADYDGDGKDDIAIYRPGGQFGGEWWISRSTQGLLSLQFGGSTDKTVPADYTGDGKADIAFWRPSTGEWYIIRSEDFSFYAVPFGTNGDVPSPGDYDGDGRSDLTVFRPSQATWYIAGTTSGTQIIGFGLTGDRPIPNSFVR